MPLGLCNGTSRWFDLEEHFRILEKVLNLMELRLEKCEFLFSKTDYLGYIINNQW